jgi:uncharacterized membrane protein
MAGASKRIVGVDAARALASLLMLQGHAFHGWASPGAKGTAAYGFTRVLGTFPLPSFLVLAGAGMALRLEVAHRRAENVATLRRSLFRRGLEVLGYGYLLSLVYALLDGGLRWAVLLRVDVLHVIGLSIASAALIGVRPSRDGRVDRSAFARRVGLAAVAVTLLCPSISALSAQVEGPARFVIGLFADVPRVGLMPLVPLFAWLGAGAVAMHLVGSRRLERPSFAIGLLGAGLVAIGAGLWATPILAALDPAPGRAGAAIVANVIELGGRGLVVLAVGGLVGPHLRGGARRWVLMLGQGSLFVYAVHIPFCYGRLGAPVRGQLSMASATLLVVTLIVASSAALALRDRLRERWREAKPALA